MTIKVKYRKTKDGVHEFTSDEFPGRVASGYDLWALFARLPKVIRLWLLSDRGSRAEVTCNVTYGQFLEMLHPKPKPKPEWALKIDSAVVYTVDPRGAKVNHGWKIVCRKDARVNFRSDHFYSRKRDAVRAANRLAERLNITFKQE